MSHSLSLVVGSPNRKSRKKITPAFTLLEVIIALAILAGALATFSEVWRQSDENAQRASEGTMAQLIATSLLAKIKAGILEPVPVEKASLEYADENWTYSIQTGETPLEELISVQVTVEAAEEQTRFPVRFELIRWIKNPDYHAEPPAVEESSPTDKEATSESRP